MKLKHIKIHNFKSIYGDFDLDFERINGFWKIEGPVGAGKTTIGEAIIFGLFGDVKGKNNADLISWGEKKGFVTIDCECQGHKLNITRVIRGDLSVFVDNEPMVFTNKRDAQSQLEDEYYDVSKMTLELLCIISFNNFKSLSNMTPADSRAFLDQVFGFSILSEYSENCKVKKKEVVAEISAKKSERRSIIDQIKKIEDLSNYERIEGDINQVLQQIQTIKKEQDDYVSKYNEWMSNARAELREKQDELAKVKALGTNISKEIKFIEQGTCPTCGAPIDQSQLEIKKSEREVLLNKYKEIDEQINQKNDQNNKENITHKRNIDTFCKRIAAYTELKTKLEEQQRRISINIAEIHQLEMQKQELDNVIKNLQQDSEEWDQLFDILSVSMRQHILGSFIPMLNKSIQEYTRMLQLPYIIEFDNQFKCSIRLYSFDKQINISSLSTGQLKTIDMCVILGVLKVIFCGVHFNVMFLDELFSNMDSELRSMVCSVLKRELKENQTIFIISHQEVSDASFDGTISASLKYNNGKEMSNYEIKSLYK